MTKENGILQTPEKSELEKRQEKVADLINKLAGHSLPNFYSVGEYLINQDEAYYARLTPEELDLLPRVQAIIKDYLAGNRPSLPEVPVATMDYTEDALDKIQARYEAEDRNAEDPYYRQEVLAPLVVKLIENYPDCYYACYLRPSWKDRMLARAQDVRPSGERELDKLLSEARKRTDFLTLFEQVLTDFDQAMLEELPSLAHSWLD